MQNKTIDISKILYFYCIFIKKIDLFVCIVINFVHIPVFNIKIEITGVPEYLIFDINS